MTGTRLDGPASVIRYQGVRRGLAGAPVGDDLMGYLLPFIQVANSSPFDRGDTDKHIGTAGVGLKNPKPFVALNHFTVPVAMSCSYRIDRPTSQSRLSLADASRAAGPLAAAGCRTPRQRRNLLFGLSPLSLRVRSEGGDGYRWRRPRRQGFVAGLPRVPRALAARPPRGRRAGQGRRQTQAQLLRSEARSGHDRIRPRNRGASRQGACAVVLERTPPPWKLDRKESTRLSLKYRRATDHSILATVSMRMISKPQPQA